MNANRYWTSMRSLGIDPSHSATGLVLLESADKRPRVLFEDTVVFTTLRGLERCSAIAGRMIEVLGEFKPERVVIEGYGLSWKHASSVIPMVEVGTVLRYFLKQLGYGYLEPTPNELKKAVTGNGNTAKSKMILHVFKRWGYEAKDDNRADAFGLGAIGLAHGGKLNNPTVAMREVVGALRLI